MIIKKMAMLNNVFHSNARVARQTYSAAHFHLPHISIKETTGMESLIMGL